jgi:hypothetical protein
MKYALLSHHQDAGENRDIRIANKSFENLKIACEESEYAKCLLEWRVKSK